ncbi:tellurite resistance TerB family protein [Vibrio sp. S4M6]|uniref:tellurite resistance TerB family protein n=1 Tax=Vibrio sinus TaxID=2946865 RepID=UPI002029CF4D|nr:tellurite resistance TerB family protein [Vibrio sinus]MCL9782765.1 tellurite resistance TerB family protein [Vibrio sinus]
MNLKSLLNQALNSDIVRQGQEQIKTQSANLKNNPDTLKTLGAGALGGGIIGLLMGSKKTQKMGKSALKVGGAAALGALAYKVYRDYQNKQPSDSTASQSPSEQLAAPEHFDANDDIHNVLIIKSMIAAAKADGHVDDQEMASIEETLQGIGADEHVRALVKDELNKPLDPAEIAKLAASPEQASEIYLASLIVVDEQNFMEKAYLKELANQLNLAPEVIEQLELQLKEQSH